MAGSWKLRMYPIVFVRYDGAFLFCQPFLGGRSSKELRREEKPLKRENRS